jgi:hypothetical protein
MAHGAILDTNLIKNCYVIFTLPRVWFVISRSLSFFLLFFYRGIPTLLASAGLVFVSYILFLPPRFLLKGWVRGTPEPAQD